MIATRWLPSSLDYSRVWQAMRDFTCSRQADTADEIWLIEHQPVYTLGQAGRAEHILNAADIPVVQCDRGGQVTYHGPGQVTLYCLIDLRRHHLFVREYVRLLEDVTIGFLHELGVAGARRLARAPGVYVPRHDGLPAPAGRGVGLDAMDADADVDEGLPGTGFAKLAALGIKVSQGCAYHGLALNVDMDLSPFEGINPCGYERLAATDLRRCGVRMPLRQAGDMLAAQLVAALARQRSGNGHAPI